MLDGDKRYEIILGDSLESLKNMPDNSIDCCITSPPYYGLRDYGTGKWVGGDKNCPHKRLSKYSEKTTTGHQQVELAGNVGDAIYKTVCPLCGAVRVDRQIGLEETPKEYIEKLVNVFREVKRVLKDDGTLWVNIGDSYNTGPTGSIRSDKQKTNVGSGDLTSIKKLTAECKPKDLIGIPWMLAFALRDDGWYLRQDIIWHKPNPMPESVEDRCTKSHEYIFLLSKSPNYYFDFEAIEEPANYDGRSDTLLKGSQKYRDGSYLQTDSPQTFAGGQHERWKFKTGIKFGGNKYGDNDDTHFQTYSGNTWTPKYKNLEYDGQSPNTMHKLRAEGISDEMYAVRRKRDVWTVSTKPYKGAHFATFPEELIEPAILAGCRVGGTVLDPFSGSGTTGVVALRNDRKYIGLELNKEYVDLSIKRIEESLDNQVIISGSDENREVEIIGRTGLW